MRHALVWTFASCLSLLGGVASAAVPQWLVLPPTPTLPKAVASGYAPVDGIRIWYAEFGHGPPVILLHGGLANADYWGNQVRALDTRYRVIVMDSRGHGRSTRNAAPFGYDLMADDVLGLMSYLKIPKAAIVGWSDGAIVGLDLSIHHADRVTRLFAFAANSDPSGVKDVSQSPIFTHFIARARREYQRLSPTPHGYDAFLAQITRMWATQPHFTTAELEGIKVPTWIVDADHDEAIRRENTLFMADHIPDSGLLILPQVSHFAFLQDPRLFDAALRRFLADRGARYGVAESSTARGQKLISRGNPLAWADMTSVLPVSAIPPMPASPPVSPDLNRAERAAQTCPSSGLTETPAGSVPM